MSDKLNKNLWGGRFKGEAEPGFAEFNRSFGFDRRLFEVDVRASIAHCDGLAGASGERKTELVAALYGQGGFDGLYFQPAAGGANSGHGMHGRRLDQFGAGLAYAPRPPVEFAETHYWHPV